MNKNFWICPNCNAQNPLDLTICEVCDFERPVIVLFASKGVKQVKRGSYVHLVWETKNAPYCFINGARVGSSGEGDFVVESEFVLKATKNKDLGFEEKRIKFTILPNPEILEFNVSNKRIKYGESLRVSWVAVDVSKVLLSDRTQEYKCIDSVNLFPKTNQSYSFSFVSDSGDVIKKEVPITVEIPNPNIQILEWPPKQCPRLQTVRLSWRSEYVKNVEYNGVSYKKDDAIELFLNNDIHNVLVFHGEDGSTYPCRVDVEVYAPIKIKSCTEQLTIRAGEEGTISWCAENVDYVLIETEKFGAKDEYTIKAPFVNNPSIQHYNILFVSKYQTDRRIVDANILPPSPVIKSLSIDGQTYLTGEKIHISWSSENVKKVTIVGESNSFLPDDSYVATADSTMSEYRIVFHGIDKSKITKNVQVNIYPKPYIKCSVSDEKVNRGHECSISWDCRNVSKVVCDGLEYSAKDGVILHPRETVTKRVDFYDLKGNLCSSKTKTIEVTSPGCGKVILCVVFAILIGFFVSLFIGNEPSSPGTTTTGRGDIASFEKHLNQADVDHIEELDFALKDLKEINQNSNEKKRLREKANSIKRQIENSPVSHLPVNKEKIAKINGVLNKL